MTKAIFLFLAAAAGLSGGTKGAPAPASSAVAADPVVTDGDKYHVVLENERVRVLRYHDEPGQKTHLHHHPSFVVYALAPFKRQLSGPDGSKRQKVFKAGEAMWVPAESHLGENIGDVPTDALIVELKEPAAVR